MSRPELRRARLATPFALCSPAAYNGEHARRLPIEVLTPMRIVVMPRGVRGVILAWIAICLLAVAAQGADRNDPGWLLPMPEVDADPKIPTLKQHLGHGWGEDISSHAEIERYLRALTAAAPERSRLVKYGNTIEKRGLYLLAITAAKNLSRLDEIREANLRLA